MQGAKADLDAISRREFSRLVSVITRRLGPHALEIAEDAVQDAFVAAARSWSADEIPANPAGWLQQVAWRKALDQLRRKGPTASLDEIAATQAAGPGEDPGEIADAELQLILLCCHPGLVAEAQVALTLRIAAGFSIAEIARLLGSDPDAVDQRLLRARRRLRSEGELAAIADDDLPRRAAVALDVIYAMFSEGYASHSAATGLRKEFCLEAIRLTMQLHRNPRTTSGEAHALTALLAFQASRLDARYNEAGTFRSLRDQDRSGWDQSLIALGFAHLSAARGDTVSRFHLEAEIASCHALASSFEATDWNRIVEIYDLLQADWPSAQLALSRAIALGERDGPRALLERLAAIEDQLSDNAQYHAATADAHHRLGDTVLARESLRRALGLAIAPRTVRTIEERLAGLSE